MNATQIATSSRISSESSLDAPPCSPALLAASLALLAVLSVADILSPGTSIAVLFPLPLILFTRAGYVRQLRWLTLASIGLVFAAHFIKNGLLPSGTAPLFDYRLVNRSLIAVAIAALGMLLEFRVATDFLRGDWELPEYFRREEDEIDETLALLAGVLLVAATAVVDFLSPANYNLAVLYLLPLFLCVWIRSRRLLWVMLGMALVLTYLGYILGPPPTAGVFLDTLPINRILTVVSFALVTVLLHFRIPTLRVDAIASEMSSLWQSEAAA
jgi:hypothetical protein